MVSQKGKGVYNPDSGTTLTSCVVTKSQSLVLCYLYIYIHALHTLFDRVLHIILGIVKS